MTGTEWASWPPGTPEHQDGLWRALRLMLSASHLRTVQAPANLAGPHQPEYAMRDSETRDQNFGGASKTPVPAARGNTNTPPKPAPKSEPTTDRAAGSAESTGTSGSGSSVDQTGKTEGGDNAGAGSSGSGSTT